MHDFKVGIGYDDDIEAAFTIIKEVISTQTGVQATPEPVYFVEELGDSAVIVCCR